MWQFTLTSCFVMSVRSRFYLYIFLAFNAQVSCAYYFMFIILIWYNVIVINIALHIITLYQYTVYLSNHLIRHIDRKYSFISRTHTYLTLGFSMAWNQVRFWLYLHCCSILYWLIIVHQLCQLHNWLFYDILIPFKVTNWYHFTGSVPLSI